MHRIRIMVSCGYLEALQFQVSVSVSVSLSVTFPSPCLSSYSCQLKYGAMNLNYLRHDNHIVTPNGRTKWRGNLKGLSHDKGQVKTAENIGVSLFKRDLLTPLSAKSILLESPFKTKNVSSIFMGHSLQYLTVGGQSSGISNQAATIVSLVWISRLLLKSISSSMNNAAICQVAGGPI
jgi:hypothetical protein